MTSWLLHEHTRGLSWVKLCVCVCVWERECIKSNAFVPPVINWKKPNKFTYISSVSVCMSECVCAHYRCETHFLVWLRNMNVCLVWTAGFSRVCEPNTGHPHTEGQTAVHTHTHSLSVSLSLSLRHSHTHP